MFTPAAAALLVRRNGGTDDEAIFLASVVPGESGGDPSAVNERYSCGTEDGRTLHAVGLFQICDYSDRGSRAELLDPDHNAAIALAILRSQGERAWTAEPDPDATDEARRALAAEGGHMQTWHPRANYAPASREGSSYVGAPWKLVIHTIEAPAGTRYGYNSGSYYGHQSWPHATIDTAGIHQHLPIDVGAAALYRNGVQTNRANAIQCEVMGQAARIRDLPEATMRHLADWLSWCAEQTGCPTTFAAFSGGNAYGENAPQRFSEEEWLAFSGVCGHQHVPENDHWDPGAIDVARLAALMGTPTNQEDFLMSLTPAQAAELYETTKATNVEVGKLATAIRDSTSGMQVQIDRLIAEVAKLKK